jgi:tetratricopeptide (TPR) repeat protein
MPLWKKLVFGVATIVLLFGGVEMVLWAAGTPTLLSERDPFAGFSRRMPVYELDADDGVYRTLERATRHSFNAQTFASSKPDDGLRIFVIGGSSAYGFPWNADAAFSRHLQDALQAGDPARPVEVINAAAMSYGSHRLRILTHELLRYEPDAIVVYGGHNEFVERRFYRDRLDSPARLDGLRSLLFRWRLYSALTRLYERAGSSADAGADPNDATTGELLGLDVAREVATGISHEERAEVRAKFEDNLRAIVDEARRSGVRVILCTVPSNLSGWVPNESRFAPAVDSDARRRVEELLAGARLALEQGNAEEAANMLARAQELAPTHADVNYYLGRALEASGRMDEAHTAFVQARDHDQQPARAVSALNDTLRTLGGELDVTLVDVERAFEEAVPGGLLGFNLFEDYVHPKPGAHKLIALELWRPFRPNTPDEEFWAAIGDTAESAIAADGTAPAAADDAAGKTATQLFNLAIVLGNQGLVDEAIEKYRACVALDPAHLMARSNMGRLFVSQGRLAEAAAVQREALAINPNHTQALLGLGDALRRMNRLDEAGATFERVVANDSGSVLAWRGLAMVSSQQKDWNEASKAYRRAAELDPTEPDIQAELGVVYLTQQKVAEAEAAFRACIRLAPDNVMALNGLASLAAHRGEYAEAQRGFEAVLRLDPRNPYARQALQALRRR